MKTFCGCFQEVTAYIRGGSETKRLFLYLLYHCTEMEKFQTILKIATKQSNFGFGLVALITAGGEQIFSSVAFKCPCNELSFIYGLVFLVVPALALLLFGFILSKKTWKLTTGLCHRKTKLCKWRNLKSMGLSVFQISACALVAPTSWTAVALLHGSYYECAMTGANFSSYRQDLCRGVNSEVKCQTELQKFPCEKAGNGREEVLRNLRAQSQVRHLLKNSEKHSCLQP